MAARDRREFHTATENMLCIAARVKNNTLERVTRTTGRSYSCASAQGNRMAVSEQPEAERFA